MASAFKADRIIPNVSNGVLYGFANWHILAGAIGEPLKLRLLQHADAPAVHFIHFKLLRGAAEIPIALSIYSSVRELFLNAATFDCEEAFAANFAFALNFDLGFGFKDESLRVMAKTYVLDVQFAIGSLLVHGAVLLVSFGCLSWSVLADASFVLLLVGRLMSLEVLDDVVFHELATTCSFCVNRECTGVSGVLLGHIGFAQSLYQCLVPSLYVRPKVPGVRLSITASNRHSMAYT